MESFNATFRTQCLDAQLFASLMETQQMLTFSLQLAQKLGLVRSG